MGVTADLPESVLNLITGLT